jgi:single-strand DNA-binding protein
MPIGQTPITVIGNLTADPELRFTATGVPVVTFVVASTERRLDKDSGQYVDGETLFLRCNLWRQDAENLCESAAKGTRIMVSGTLKQRTWEDGGNKRTSYEVQAEEVGVSLKWATARPVKVHRHHGPVPEDPWASTAPAPGAPADEPPF